MVDSPVSLLERGFALTIAFILPGLVTLFGIATVNATVQQWFQGAQDGPTIVGFLFVLFAALALNIVITAMRWFFFEQLTIKPLGCPWVSAPPAVNHAQRKDLETQYIDLRLQHYYHYLAYANTAVAVPLAVASWKIGATVGPSWPVFLWVIAGTCVVSFVLKSAACHAIARYDEKLVELLGHGQVPSRPAA